MYLIQVQINDRKSQSEYLKTKIISLSKEYIDAIAKEKGLYSTGLGDEDNGDVRELKKATAVLLQNMLARIKNLERQVEDVIVNSTAEFKHLTIAIKSLNRTINNLTKSTDEDLCYIPDNPAYPECSKKVDNIGRKIKSMRKQGINGSVCSILIYLSEVEQWCPRNVFKLKIKPVTDEYCVMPSDPAFPHCAEKVKWMEKFWRSDMKYQSHGVDGNLCSFLKYLSEVENFCPLRSGRHMDGDCKIPVTKEFPECASKINWMRQFWKSDKCYEQDHGVNGSICSFISYLSEVERIPDLERTDVQGLLNHLQDANAVKFQWMKRRIVQMWPKWQAAISSLKNKKDLTKTVQKKVLIHIGLLANENKLHFAEEAGKGGPLGELVQWSDVITSLYILGHDITVTADLAAIQKALGNVVAKKLCPQKLPNDIDLVYVDYIGLRELNSKIGTLLPQFLCKLRVVDSFGTEAQFNFNLYKEKIDGGSMGAYGRYNLNLRQYQTMFPHSPDNTFLGFVVNVKPLENTDKKMRRKAKALVYGKHYSMWKDLPNKTFLEVVNRYLEVHATVGGGSASEVSSHLPSFVINHGVVTPMEVQKLLNESMVFVGLGFPYEGPAPLEAIANGCFFINPKFNPPRSRLNTPFFKNKPTLRLFTSQHPYCEEFIGKPHVYTIDVKNVSEVERVMKEIMLKEVDPYLPFEFTHEGMLERVNALVQHQDFCYQNHWPPLKALITEKGGAGKSCKDVCLAKGMVCEPEFFNSINSRTSLIEHGFPCNTSRLEEVPSLIAPGFRPEPAACIVQTQALMFSCTGTSPSTMRLCPCRKYKKGQVALCVDC
ncbi:Alpha-1,6-mannosylglycoprotein 6-beta-N-acetylglucosaminyltransferase A [Desmophyllum pertusum]|uniref:alpha-1,6-mannosyl-glycoprotein 6-beta-N-acetylglucosaminyltransferase n=1 Tax=Desmophyllum pertusum TaxID=174260 RepID=A0A9X0CGV3_9CNID|nr:Alpha-1,6-mannosylglycoprotein 6-beta-N-acetylglucosaminyltransferase A [Desmophyllum pertusum]